MEQIANVASLPGIVGKSMGMPDLHSGYGFSIGGVAAFDMNDPQSIVSPGGVGFDISKCVVLFGFVRCCDVDKRLWSEIDKNESELQRRCRCEGRSDTASV